jgi:hypothetical protein
VHSIAYMMDPIAEAHYFSLPTHCTVHFVTQFHCRLCSQLRCPCPHLPALRSSRPQPPPTLTPPGPEGARRPAPSARPTQPALGVVVPILGCCQPAPRPHRRPRPARPRHPPPRKSDATSPLLLKAATTTSPSNESVATI